MKDSIKSAEKYPLAEYFQEKNLNQNSSLYTPIDTLLDGVQKYFPNNFPYSLGLASRKLSFESSPEIGFRSGFNKLDLFGYNKEAIKYYRARTPYTEIFGVFGMKKEQFSKLLHTQNINRQWNIALNMLRLRSEGFYQRQNCSDNNISFSTNYGSKNTRYSLLANAIVSSIKSDENGGIEDDSIFLVRLKGNKKLIPVNLMDARTKRRHREFYVKQGLYFGKKENVMNGDSVVGRRIRPDHALTYSLHINDEEFAYAENTLDSSFYEYNLFDSTQTRDSTHIETFTHTFGIYTTFSHKVRMNLDVENNKRRFVQYNEDSARVLDSSFSGQSVRIMISNNTGKKDQKLSWRIGKQYVIKGQFEFDDHVFANISYALSKEKKIIFDYQNISRAVPMLYNYYASNHFWWKNDLGTVYETSFNLKYKDRKHKFYVGGELRQVIGHVYFDTSFLPKQFDTILLIRSAFVQKNFHAKHFGFNNKIVWQDVTEDVIRIPKLITNHSIYYEGRWFKKAVGVQLGFDITYYSSYFADAYMPALGQFYQQNEKEFGNYPFVDFFFNMKIKHARVFFKTEHLNSGFTGSNYFLAPHMPAPDRSIRIGVKWMFYD